jgi:hypothetical protein
VIFLAVLAGAGIFTADAGDSGGDDHDHDGVKLALSLLVLFVEGERDRVSRACGCDEY